MLDLVSLPVRDPFFPTGTGSILGLVGLIPLVGYAFNIRVLNNSLRKILFLFQTLAMGLAFGVLAYAHLPFGDSRMEFSPVTLLVVPAAFVILYPWYRYAFRSPGLWNQNRS